MTRLISPFLFQFLILLSTTNYYIKTLQDGVVFPEEDQLLTFFNKPSYPSCHTVTAGGSTAQWTVVLTCALERGASLLHGGATETAADRLLVRREANGTYMEPSASGGETVLPPTIQCLLGSPVTKLGFYRK